jgi:hypothetical protein
MIIKFIPYDDLSDLILEIPQPSSKFIPQWYKKNPKFINDDKVAGLSENNSIATNTTIKSCSPFLDALSFGYVWSSPVDIEIKKDDNEYFFRWRTEGNFVSSHDLEQHSCLPTMMYGNNLVMKWQFNFGIKTPKGYSTFFTHPLNRHDLPFRTFSGVVDTDSYSMPVQFPFQFFDIENNTSLIIEKGTPLCQFFPVQRKKWTSKKEKLDLNNNRKERFNFYSKIQNSYKNNFWNKKFFN